MQLLYLLILLCCIPLLATASIPMHNGNDVIKRNKVSYVRMSICGGGESLCFVIEDRYDKRGNCIYSHLLRTGSGSIMEYNNNNLCTKRGWGLWGEELESPVLYEYDSCHNVMREIYTDTNDTTLYENEYDAACRLIKKTAHPADRKSFVEEENEYNTAGLVVKQIRSNKIYITQYDSCGNITLQTLYEEGTKVRDWQYTYDQWGRLTYMEITPSEGVPYTNIVEDGCETRLFTYESKGRIHRHYEYFGDPCMGGYYMDLVYEYLPNGLLAHAYWYGDKKKKPVVAYDYNFH